MPTKFWMGNSGAAKLTPAQVQEMRQLYDRGLATQRMLCRQYKIGIAQVGKIVRRESWVDLPDLPSGDQLAEAAERAMQVQAEVKAQDGPPPAPPDSPGEGVRSKLEEAIAAERERGRAGDAMLDELMGRAAAGQTGKEQTK